MASCHRSVTVLSPEGYRGENRVCGITQCGVFMAAEKQNRGRSLFLYIESNIHISTVYRGEYEMGCFLLFCWG